MSPRRTLITGASGFIGRRLLACLTSGVRVVAISRAKTPADFRGVAWEHRDLAKREDWTACLLRWRPRILIHLARPTGARLTPEECYDGILRMTQGMIDGFAAHVPERLVCIGSADEYGRAPAPQMESGPTHPTNAYGRAKLEATRLVLEAGDKFGVETIVLRPFLVYGPGQAGPMLIPSCIEALLAGRAFRMSLGEQRRDPVYVEDVVRGIRLAAFGRRRGALARSRVFNICTGESVSIIELARTIRRLVGRGNLEVGAIPYRPEDPMELVGNPGAMKTEFGFKAKVSWNEGLRRTVREAARASPFGHPTGSAAPGSRPP